MDNRLIEGLGDELYEALAAGRVLDPLTDRHPGITIEDAYHVQQRMIARRLARGEKVVGKKIGEGGMGLIYGGIHPIIGKKVALKILNQDMASNPDVVQRFILEAKAVNQIGHPNIVDVFAFGELPDGRNYFVMEYLQGESLADRLGKGALPLGEAVERYAAALPGPRAIRRCRAEQLPDRAVTPPQFALFTAEQHRQPSARYRTERAINFPRRAFAAVQDQRFDLPALPCGQGMVQARQQFQPHHHPALHLRQRQLGD